MILYIYILFYALISAYFNYEIITNQDWHGSQAFLRIFAFIGVLLIHVDLSFWNVLLLLFQSLTIYWIAFDLLLNLFRFGFRGLLYVGNSSFIDITLGKWIYLIKFIFLLSFIL